MSVLHERIATLPEFLDIRRDQLLDVLRAVKVLQDIRVDDPNEMLRIIEGLRLYEVSRAYSDKCNTLMGGNRGLNRLIQDASFRQCKTIVGDDDYV